MYIVVKSTDNVQEIESKLSRFFALRAKRKIKVFDSAKYAGKLKGLYDDGSKYQRRLRNEWGP